MTALFSRLYDRCRSTHYTCHINNCFSSSILHLLHVLSTFCFLLYLFLTLSIHFHWYSNYQPEVSSSLPLSYSYLTPFPHYQPTPVSSICTSYDRLQHILLSATSIVSKGLQCFAIPLHSTISTRTRSCRHARFLFYVLLLLAGDINLNPGPNTLQSLHFSQYNIRSASSVTIDLDKPACLQDFILTQNIDILTLSETWLSSDSPPAILNSLTPTNYSLIHVPRPNKIGGVLAFIYRSILNVHQISLPSFLSFESMCARISLPSTSLIIISGFTSVFPC